MIIFAKMPTGKILRISGDLGMSVEALKQAFVAKHPTLLGNPHKPFWLQSRGSTLADETTLASLALESQQMLMIKLTDPAIDPQGGGRNGAAPPPLQPPAPDIAPSKTAVHRMQLDTHAEGGSSCELSFANSPNSPAASPQRPIPKVSDELTARSSSMPLRGCDPAKQDAFPSPFQYAQGSSGSLAESYSHTPPSTRHSETRPSFYLPMSSHPRRGSSEVPAGFRPASDSRRVSLFGASDSRRESFQDSRVSLSAYGSEGEVRSLPMISPLQYLLSLDSMATQIDS